MDAVAKKPEEKDVVIDVAKTIFGNCYTHYNEMLKIIRFRRGHYEN